MRYLFLGTFYDDEKEIQLLTESKVGIPNACNTLQWNLIKGLEGNLNIPIAKVTSMPLGNFPIKSSKLFIKSDNQNNKYVEVGFVNFYIIKHWIRKRYIYKIIKHWLLQDNTQTTIFVYDIYLPYLQCLEKLKSAFENLKICVIVTDLPGKNGANIVNSKLASILLNNRFKKQYTILKKMDFFVFITKQMATLLDIDDSKYCVVEGIANMSASHNTRVQKNIDKKIIMYTGALEKEYGILTLLDAFSKIKEDNYELWLCGNGDAVSEIKKYSLRDKRIVLWGYVSKEKIIELQHDITLYINPRPNIGEYTKYSFPSKTMEYMLSGVPVLMYKLDGMPKEYENYLYFIKDDTIQCLTESIIEVCEKTSDELWNKACEAREFVINKKNELVQTKKILNMLLLSK